MDGKVFALWRLGKALVYTTNEEVMALISSLYLITRASLISNLEIEFL